jgi:hypothetical protein
MADLRKRVEKLEAGARSLEDGQRIVVILLDPGQPPPPRDDPRIQAAIQKSKSPCICIDLSRSASSTPH